jgi:hypothetical protein
MMWGRGLRMEHEDEVGLLQLWSRTTETVKKIVIHPSLWKAMEVAQPITIDGGVLVLGFPIGTFDQSGHLLASNHKNAIEKVLTEFHQAPLTFRVIDGVDAVDWRHVKERDERVREMQAEASEKRAREESIVGAWDDLYDRVTRIYAQLPLRQFPQRRALYVRQAVAAISEVMEQLADQRAVNEELFERSIARAIDKVSTLANLPGTMVAIELVRHREREGLD